MIIACYNWSNKEVIIKTSHARNYGIDVLRLITMLMIVILHVLGQGGILEALAPFNQTAKFQVAWILEILCYCAVNCYALISGYVGAKSHYKYTNMIMIWLRTLFYSVLITMIFAILRPHLLTSADWWGAFFPIISGQYWYVTAYLILFLFMPVLNIALQRLSRVQLLTLVLSCTVFLSILPTFLQKDIFELGFGYSAWWLIVAYLIGGYFSLYPPKFRFSKRTLFISFIASSLLAWLLQNFFQLPAFVDYTSPLILANSVFLLLLFSKLYVGPRTRRLVARLAPLTFSVYLIHSQPLIFHYLMENRFIFLCNLSTITFVPAIIGISLTIYIICSLLDFIREYIFCKAKLKQRITKLEQTLLAKAETL